MPGDCAVHGDVVVQVPAALSAKGAAAASMSTMPDRRPPMGENHCQRLKSEHFFAPVRTTGLPGRRSWTGMP